MASEVKKEDKKPLIEVRDVWKSYGPLQVLKGINLTIYEGETLVILGRSGVGKSVLLRQIIGIENPDRGSITFGQGVGPSDVGMLFQGSALFDSMNVGENTAFFLRQHPDPTTGVWLSAEELKERVNSALCSVGLEGTEEKMPSDLSGGMRKRAALARLIAYRPKVVLYDEPTTGLDPVTAMQINELILHIQKELKATSIVVTHDILSAMKVGNRLAFHHDGQIIHVAPVDEFFQSDAPIIKSFFANAVLNTHQVKS